jgi:hypothetical protein
MKVVRAFLFFIFNLLAAFACAVAFVAALHFTLPKSDLAHGVPFLRFLQDPFVLFGILGIGGLSGFVSFFILTLRLKGRPRYRCTLFILGIVLLQLIVFTPFLQYLAWLLSYVTYLVALTICHRSSKRYFVLTKISQQNYTANGGPAGA